MTAKEAADYLRDISFLLGTTGVEYLTQKDGEKMREAISTLEAQDERTYIITDNRTAKLSKNSPKLDSGNRECKWCENIEDRHLRIEYYWIDDEGNTASFSQPHHIATGIANYCPNCGRKLKDQEESDGNSKD